MPTAAQRCYDNLTEKQSQSLQEFRKTVQDVLQEHHDDFFVLRWLVARDFDLNKAEKMLRNHLEWRKLIGADTILEDYDPPEVLKKYYTGGCCGRDKEGDLLWIDPFGNVDLKGLLMSVMKREILHYQAWKIEGVFRLFKELPPKENRRVTSLTNIFDLQNFGLRHFWGPGVDLFNDMTKVFDNHYPETLKVVLVVNAPAIFPIGYKLVSPFLSEETKAKVKILGGNYKQELLQYVDADQLPVFYGGTKIDDYGDPKCSSQICYGGEVPKSYYSNKSTIPLENCTQTVIGRASTLQLSFNVTKRNSVLRWFFMTDDNDIAFGITYVQDETLINQPDLHKDILPLQRVNSHLVPEDGTVTCKDVGTYVVRFDNKHSWLRSKKIQMKIDVLEPAQTDCVIDQLPDV